MARQPPPARPRVLVVENDDNVRDVVCLLLSLSGYEVREAADGPEGLRRALLWRPDAVITDIGLPGLDGWELARRVRAGLGEGVRLVALTGFDDPGTRAAARRPASTATWPSRRGPGAARPARGGHLSRRPQARPLPPAARRSARPRQRGLPSPGGGEGHL
jgi:CheY-like chemotaxis protein